MRNRESENQYKSPCLVLNLQPLKRALTRGKVLSHPQTLNEIFAIKKLCRLVSESGGCLGSFQIKKIHVYGIDRKLCISATTLPIGTNEGLTR